MKSLATNILVLVVFIFSAQAVGAQSGSMEDMIKNSIRQAELGHNSAETQSLESQSEIYDQTAGQLYEPVLVAEVEIYDAKIISQESNIFKISFDFFNEGKVQPGVAYAVKLIKEDENGQTIVDQHVYDEILNLNENQLIRKEIEYIAPAYLYGEYSLWVVGSSKNGLPLGLSSLGEITLNGNRQFVEIQERTCFLQIEGNEEHYALSQGVDIKPVEKLLIVCDFKNQSDSDLELSPNFETFYRTEFGQKVETVFPVLEAVRANAGGFGSFSLSVPIADKPQAYRVGFSLSNGKQEMSNKIFFHYVLKGKSATIQNLRLDKNYYKAGEEASISFYWSGPADDFPMSRFKATEPGPLDAVLSIKDKDAKDCIKEKKIGLDPDSVMSAFNVVLTSDCLDPVISVNILDESGEMLDKADYSLKSSLPEVAESGQVSASAGKKITIIFLFAFLSLLLLFLVLLVMKRKRIMNLMIFFVFALLFAVLGAQDVSAKTYIGKYGARALYSDDQYLSHEVVLSFSLDKESYYPNEKMTATTYVSSYDCANSILDYSLSWGTAIHYAERPNINNSIVYFVNSTNAQSSPGTYYASGGFTDNRCYRNLGYGWCSYYELLYLGTKVAWNKKYKGIDLTYDQTRTAIINAYGSVYDHYTKVGKSGCTVGPCENIHGCISECTAQTTAPSFTGSLEYRVVAPLEVGYSCSGTAPDGAIQIMCPGDSSGLDSGLSWKNVGSDISSCTDTRKCEYYSKPVVVAPVGECLDSGSLPLTAQACFDFSLDERDNVNVSGSLPWVQVDNQDACTSRKCEWYNMVYNNVCTVNGVYIPNYHIPGSRPCPGNYEWKPSGNLDMLRVDSYGDCTDSRKCEYYVLPSCECNKNASRKDDEIDIVDSEACVFGNLNKSVNVYNNSIWWWCNDNAAAGSPTEKCVGQSNCFRMYCNGNIPSGYKACPGDGIVSCNNIGQCNGSMIWMPGLCSDHQHSNCTYYKVPDVPFKCSDVSKMPENSVVCPDDDQDLHKPQSARLVYFCGGLGGDKCEHICKPGYTKKGENCEKPGCGGSLIPNSESHDSEEEESVSPGTSWTHSATDDPGVKCQFRCKHSYVYKNGECKFNIGWQEVPAR